VKKLITGKKYWLRPGQEYTIGRNPRTLRFTSVLNIESRIELSSFKTVSKTHITIKIGEVSQGSIVYRLLLLIKTE
jgi:hypothetical protein